MNEKDLQNAVKAITLSEESKQKISRKLELLSREEHVFQAEPARLPIFRYALSGMMACAIIAVSVGGLLQLTRTPSESQSQFEPGESMAFYDPDAQTLFDSDLSGENRIYAIMQESDKQYFSISESDTLALRDALQTTLASRASEDFKTTFMVGGNKEFIICTENSWLEFWKDADSIAIIIQYFEDSEKQSYCIGISPEEYDRIKALLANPVAYFDLPATNSEQEILEYLFREKISPFGDVSQMQERLIFSDYKLQYLIPTQEQHEKLAELLNQAEWNEIQVADLDTSVINSEENSEENPFFTIYFDTPEERFTVHFSSHITVTGDNSQRLYQLYENSDLVSQIRELFLPAETRYQIDPQNNNLFGQLFDEEPVEIVNQESISPFGDVSQMQERAIFTEYAPLYLIPTDEQHEKLAELLNQAEWEQLPADDPQIPILEDGEFFTIYFDTPEERFTVRFQLSGLIIKDLQGLYYNPELVSEIRDVFIPSETRYQFSPTDALYELTTDQIFEQMFDEEPIAFHPDSNPVTIQIENTQVLIHDESFSRDAQGNYHVENDTQYLISQERKQQLSDFIASQELQAIVGFPDFEKGDQYQKFVVEFTEQDGFLTLEYDVENEHYYLILCTQMEVPG